MSEQSELLSQLKIDRTEESASGGLSIGAVAVLMLAASVGSGFGALALFGDSELVASPDASMAQNAAGAKAPATPSINAATATGSKPAAAPTDVSNRILNASGYITARRMATVSAEIMGLITAVNVEEGMAVKTGQVLAQLDSAVAKVNLDLAEAKIKVSEARIGRTKADTAEAERVLARVQALNSRDFSTEADLTRSQAAVEGFRADIIRMQADVKVAKLDAQRQREHFDNHTIKAPFSGIVTVKNAQPGEIVSPSSAGGGFTRTGICTIVDMASLEIEVDVNEAFIGRVFAGQTVEANLDAYPDWTIPASVIAVIPTADRAKATVRVRIKIETNDVRILPDMGVKVAFLKA
ncbi:MAG: efflux RND transporter periplasmic adaptor subunit [Kordiimonadaceae bacterium]|nr:efflux RND transporter periplasmic adaptor subunit [Kordiimonadaceae bacterium]